MSRKKAPPKLEKWSGPPLSPDSDLENADWIKQRWPFPWIKTKEELLGLLSNQGMTVDEFKKLPIYKRNVDKVDVLRTI